jgi:hypothetical protein
LFFLRVNSGSHLHGGPYHLSHSARPVCARCFEWAGAVWAAQVQSPPGHHGAKCRLSTPIAAPRMSKVCQAILKPRVVT